MGLGTDPLIGTVINGKFRILRQIARGGMGKIYEAEQAPIGRSVAIKILRSRYSDEALEGTNFHKRFLLEASMLSKLQHANVVTLYDYGKIENVEGEQFFMAMELLRGETLAERIQRKGRLSIIEVIRIFKQIAKALREAHNAGIVHRDLKPANVMLVPDPDEMEVVKILDFGIGTLVRSDSGTLTEEGSFLGSPRYMAPEQVGTKGDFDGRTDSYAIGVMIYEALTGHPPFQAETDLHLMMMHRTERAPSLSSGEHTADVPEEMDSLVRELLEKDRAKRPIAAEILSRLRAMEAGDSDENASRSYIAVAPSTTGLRVNESQTATKSQSIPPTVRNRKWWIGGAAAVFATIVFLVGRRLVSESQVNPFEVRPTTSATAIADPATSRFSLSLETTPSGASVFEGDVFLGTTPMQLAIDRATVAKSERIFVLKKDGYSPFTLRQGDSTTAVRAASTLERSSDVPLEPPRDAAPSASASAEPRTEPRPRIQRAATPLPAASSTSAPASSSSVEIRTTR